MEFDGYASWFQSPDMKLFLPRVVLVVAIFSRLSLSAHCAGANPEPAWRSLPIITNGKVDTNWVHVGWGRFIIDDGMLRTDPAREGLGLLVFKAERFGDCQLRVVFKTRDAKSNSGVYVRLADGILSQVGKTGAAFDRDAAGKISKESMAKMQESGERDEGAWYGVHHGYEVQIADGGDPYHCTGSIYSLAPSSAAPTKGGEWRTLVITLAGQRISAEIDGKPVASVDTESPDLPPRKIWHEPKREPKRPVAGYVGLQTHDPGDIVWFKEISVRPLPAARAN